MFCARAFSQRRIKRRRKIRVVKGNHFQSQNYMWTGSTREDRHHLPINQPKGMLDIALKSEQAPETWETPDAADGDGDWPVEFSLVTGSRIITSTVTVRLIRLDKCYGVRYLKRNKNSFRSRKGTARESTHRTENS